MKQRIWIPIVFIWLSSACTVTDGQCWLRSEDGGGTGAGGGVIAPPYGGGDYGDLPPSPQGAGDSTPPDCVGIGSYSSSSFVFKTTQEDDGVGFGWQEATPTLKFADGRQEPVQAWTCTLNVGMPLRTKALGKISADWAAKTSAEIATEAGSPVMHSKDAWTPAAFCKAFKDTMVLLFKQEYEGLGARVEVVGSGG